MVIAVTSTIAPATVAPSDPMRSALLPSARGSENVRTIGSANGAGTTDP